MAPTSLLVFGGTVVVLATSSVVGLHIFASVHIDEPRALRGAAVVSACLESLVLLMLGWLAASHVFRPLKLLPKPPPLVALGVQVAVCVLGAIASVVALACLSRSRADDDDDASLVATKNSILTGASVVLPLAIASQLASPEVGV